MLKSREIRDPIHGFIQRTEQEEKIINSQTFQRLRRIKQLALANLVYPGAVHSRFEHSIGVMHIASRLADKLELKKGEKKIVRLAGLLHDLGHGPFSHVSEDVLEKFSNESKISSKVKEKIHESITCKIIESDNEISKLIDKTERQQIVNLLIGKNCDTLLRGIISGPLDADKQDYLLRDSHYSGVKYGIYDIERLIHSLTIFKDGKERILSIPDEGVYTLEQFVIAKYHMATQVYRHKIRMISDAMIIRALQLGVDKDKLNWLKSIYTYDGTIKFIKNFLQWDDNRLVNKIIYDSKDGYAKDIFVRLIKRDLYKRVFSKDVNEFKDENVKYYLLSIIKNDKKLISEIESKIADYLTKTLNKKISKFNVIFNKYSIKSVREQSRDNEGSIIVLLKTKAKSVFEKESTLFKSINEKETLEYIDIYAPVVYRDSKEKSKKLSEFDKEIKIIIENTINKKIKT